MRTTLLSTALPSTSSGSGASITLALIAEALAGRGHEVSLCPLVYPEYVTPDGADAQAQLAHAESLGYTVEPLISDAWRPQEPERALRARLRRAWRPPDEELLPQLRDAAGVESALAKLRPDAVFVYGFAALAASADVTLPRFAATSDPPQAALLGRSLRRWRVRPSPARIAREAVSLQAALRAYPRLHARLLRGCQAVGAFAPHHARTLRRDGIDCRYYRTPTADPGAPTPRPRNERPRLLLVGHLQGTATLDGLRVFHAMLPHLDAELGRDGYEARIVGGYEPPAELNALLSHPAVHHVGFVEDVDEEFRQADVLVVPVSIKLGVRVRVLTGLSFGSCIVTHVANTFGIPEVVHGESALIGRTASELAGQVAVAARDESLRARLGAGARATYERFFTPQVAGGEIADTLERVAGQRG